MIYVFLLLFLYFSLSSKRFVELLRKFYDSKHHGILLVIVLGLPFVLASIGNALSDPRSFLIDSGILYLYLLVPGVLLILRPLRSKPLDAYDAAAVIAIWLPVEFDWLPEFRINIAGSGIPVALVTAIVLGFILYQVLRPLKHLGYTFILNKYDLLKAFAGVASFAVIGLPLGVITGFIQPGFDGLDISAWVVRLVLIFFLNALPEELLFRGVMQNLLDQRFGSTWQTWLFGAFVFGMAHINNWTAFHQPPNWHYVGMAFIAGLVYSWVWRRTSKITASAVTHTLVNFIWSTLFVS